MELDKLVLKAKSGDSASYEAIMNSFKSYLIKTCREIYINGYDMEDLIQIGYVTLIKAIQKYVPRENTTFLAYALAAIKNNYYYEIRQRSKHNAVTSLNKELETGVEIINIIASDKNLEEDFAKAEEIQALYDALLKLSPAEQALINYVYLKEGKLINYAKANNLNYVTLCKFKDRTLKKLKKLLSDLSTFK